VGRQAGEGVSLRVGRHGEERASVCVSHAEEQCALTLSSR